MTSVRLSHVSHRYGDRAVIDDLDLELRPGITALLGVNGAGKTTLLSIAAGGLRPSAGAVEVDGENLYRVAGRRRALGRVALMPQGSEFPARMTVLEVVTYLRWMRGVRTSQARADAREALVHVGLEQRLDERVAALSGGMRRRVALAQAIAGQPDVLLLDEPSTGLDPEQRRAMVDLLRSATGTVLLSSHVMEDVVELASRIVVLDGGGIVFDGTAEDLAGRAPTAQGHRAAEAGFLAVLDASRAAEGAR